MICVSASCQKSFLHFVFDIHSHIAFSITNSYFVENLHWPYHCTSISDIHKPRIWILHIFTTWTNMQLCFTNININKYKLRLTLARRQSFFIFQNVGETPKILDVVLTNDSGSSFSWFLFGTFTIYFLFLIIWVYSTSTPKAEKKYE